MKNEKAAVLDACVLYPAPMRDLLLTMADHGFFQPKWTAEIHDEWTRNLLKNRSDITKEKLAKLVNTMQEIFPDSDVQEYQKHISGIRLPDKDDRHVVAAAIESGAKVIVTNNLKDFPNKYLSQFDIIAKSPDVFVSEFIDTNPGKCMEAFRQQVKRLRNPPATEKSVLKTFRDNNLTKTSQLLDQYSKKM